MKLYTQLKMRINDCFIRVIDPIIDITGPIVRHIQEKVHLNNSLFTK